MSRSVCEEGGGKRENRAPANLKEAEGKGGRAQGTTNVPVSTVWPVQGGEKTEGGKKKEKPGEAAPPSDGVEKGKKGSVAYLPKPEEGGEKRGRWGLCPPRASAQGEEREEESRP